MRMRWDSLLNPLHSFKPTHEWPVTYGCLWCCRKKYLGIPERNQTSNTQQKISSNAHPGVILAVMFACVCVCVTEWRLFGLNSASHRWHKKQRSSAKTGRERCRSAAGGHRGSGEGSRHLSGRRKRGQRQCHPELTGSTQIFCRANSLPRKSSEVIGIISTLAAVKRKRKFCHLNYYLDSDRRDSNTRQ